MNAVPKQIVRAKLPKLEVKRFGGKIQEWQEFWDSFDSSVNQNDALSEVDKFAYLKGLLIGPAQTTIAGFTLTSSNYKEALELLKARYGKKQAIQRAHIQALMNLKPVYNERDVRRLRELYHACETNVRGLKTLGVDESSYATIVVPEILDKLPESLRLTITRGSVGSDFLNWTMNDVLKALLNEIELREAHESSTTNASKQERRRAQHLDGSAAALVNQTTKDGKPRCVYCLQEHSSQECKKIQDVGERKQILRKYGRCFICLKKGHISSKCLITSKCSACSKRHHRSICESNAKGDAPADSVNSTHAGVGSANRVALQTAQALVMGGKKNVRVRVMFDSGSQRSFITNKIVQRAGVPIKRKEWVEIRTFGNEKAEGRLREVFEISVASVQGGESVKIEVYGVDSISQIRNDHIETRKKDYPHLQGLWFSDVCKTRDVLEVELLIGADYLWLFQEGRTVRGKSDEPVAVQTKLGWVLSGPLKRGSEDDDGPTLSTQVSVNLIGHAALVDSPQNRPLEACVERLWDYETLGIKPEGGATDMLNDSIHFNGQRYSVSLPWKEGHGLLPTNYRCSVQRLKGQLLRLRKEPEVLKEYDKVIKEQLDTGIIEPVVELERAEKIHYLPHHAVVRKDAKTTKVRVVYDASSKESKKGVSLNDCLHVGPPLSSLLYHIILRFREKRIALVADIEKAFLNIEIDPGDRDCLRFLWVNNINEEEVKPVEYRFCRVVFGVNCSPFLLNATLQHHLDCNSKGNPELARKLKDGFYVDDLVTGEQTPEQALKLYESSKTHLASGGFKLRKWLSNSKTVTEHIQLHEESKPDVENLACEETFAKSSLSMAGKNDTLEKVLGLAWNHISDEFQFWFQRLVEKAKSQPVTKRNMLSILAGLFDPLGILSPMVVSIKILFQTLCIDKVDWDSALDGKHLKTWLEWVYDLEVMGQIVMPRCIYGNLIGKPKCSLHGFGDASLKAYCAVVYYVCELNGNYHVELLTSKTRVAPIKTQTIPRLELMSGLILARLIDTVKSALSVDVEISNTYYWLDSKTALCWINNQGEWKQFVRHRVNEILRLSKREEWGHCPGLENPADLGSRGVSPSKLKESTLWWKGPRWLSGPKENWPVAAEIVETEDSLKEVKKSVVVTVQVDNDSCSLGKLINVKAYSNFNKLKRIVSWVRRFVQNVRARVQDREIYVGGLTVEELRKAENDLIMDAQCSLKERKDFQQLVKQLGLVDRDGVLKCRGRLSNSDLEEAAREPIILPKDNWLTELIIIACHKRVHHCGLRATLAELRGKYWVPRGRQIVKKVIGKCVVCKKHGGKPYGKPEEAGLPEFRVRESPPFAKVGVDFAGPLYAKEGVEMVKVYIALFTCCVTRAVHLDLVRNLSVASFLNCLRRFASRRGAPTLIVSDNAKTFKAAQRAVKRLYESGNVRAYLQDNCVKWQFNLERAPWWGGFFERLVGSVKRCLRKALGNAKLTFEELLTTLVEVEGTLNTRPLTYIYDEVENDVLTPNHLIFGRRLSLIPDENSYAIEESEATEVKRRFKYLAKLRVHFWQRWRKEYVTNLREHDRCKKEKKSSNVSKGDVVLVFDENLKRGFWKLGRIESLILGRDEVIRGAKVRVLTKGKPVYLKRPVQKLYPVELEENGSSTEERKENNVKGKVNGYDNQKGKTKTNEKGKMKINEKDGEKGKVESCGRSRRAAALDARWKTQIMVDPCRLKGGSVLDK